MRSSGPVIGTQDAISDVPSEDVVVALMNPLALGTARLNVAAPVRAAGPELVGVASTEPRYSCAHT